MKAVCFGEILWDVYGESKKIGGATFNVSGHFSKLGDHSYMISALGDDELGREAFRSIASIGVDKTFVNTVSYPTGCAFVSLDNGSPSYSFNSPCAWDFIALGEEQQKKLFDDEYDVFVFGSFSQRNEVTRKTLELILVNIKAKEVFFDVNLRLNYYSKEIIENGLERTTILKVNEDEEKVIKEMFSLSDITSLFDRYKKLKMIILTCGSSGSVIYTRNEKYLSTPEDVKVIDTVGAGDSFSAVFLHFIIKGDVIPIALEKATEVASFVVQYQGALPPYSDELKKKLSI